MKTREYNNIESFINFMGNTPQEEFKLTEMILELGLNVETINSIPMCKIFYCGKHLACSGDKLFIKSDLMAQLGIINDYKNIDMYNLIENYTDRNTTIINRKNDIDILYKAYTKQWEITYGILFQYVKNGNIINQYKNNELPFLVKNIEDLKYYEELYEQTLMGIEKIKVYTRLKDKNIKHIYIDMDLDTGVPYLNVNTKYRMGIDNDNSNEYRRVFIPMSLLHIFRTLDEPLYVDITIDDLIFSNTVGKISGFDIGSRPDKLICDYLNINKLYEANGGVIQYKENKKEPVTI